MCAEFDYYLKERVHVLVLNQGDELEGFTIPTFDWIVMSANPGGGYFLYSRGRMEWFSTVFALICTRCIFESHCCTFLNQHLTVRLVVCIPMGLTLVHLDETIKYP